MHVYNLKQRGCTPFPCERPLIHLALAEVSQSYLSLLFQLIVGMNIHFIHHVFFSFLCSCIYWPLQMIQWSDMNECNWIANKFRPFSKPIWPTRSDSKEWLLHKWLIGIAGSANRDTGNIIISTIFSGHSWYEQSIQLQAPLWYSIL